MSHAPMYLQRQARHQAFDFLADEEIVGVRMAVEELETAVDAVVIGNRHQVHATRFATA
jgi:hypothetical protein